MSEPDDKYKFTVKPHGEPAEMGPARPVYPLAEVKRTIKMSQRLLRLMARRGNLTEDELNTRLAHLKILRRNIEIAYEEQSEE